LIKHVIIGTIFFIFSCTVHAQLTYEQKIARDEGIALYQQSAWDDAQPPLLVAAQAGDIKSQYYLGEAIRLNNLYTTTEAKKWYEAAAAQGDLYAMLRLSSKDDLCSDMGTCTGKSGQEWREQALKTAHERAEKGDTDAMTVLYTAKQGLKWLEKAAEAGDSYAQHLLAGVYQDGGGWFLIPGSREKAVIKWYKASAEGGYPKGMFLYASYLYDHNGNIEEIAYWLKKAAEGGHIDSVNAIAEKIAKHPNDLGLPMNLVEAYGLTYLLSKLEGGGAAPEDGRRNLPEIAEKMTTDEIEKGLEFAKTWKATHPPLSYFAPTYGY
jgi:hypothetical protein